MEVKIWELVVAINNHLEVLRHLLIFLIIVHLSNNRMLLIQGLPLEAIKTL
jgi:hypothetical protein